MQNRFVVVFTVVAALLFGCNQQPPAAVNPAPAQAKPAGAGTDADQVAEAKAHIQQFIDRLLGGDQTVKQGLLGMDGVDFNTLEAIEITSALPAYLPDGRKVDNTVRVVLNIRGYDDLKRRTIQKNRELSVILKDGRWSILGSNL